MKNYVFTLFCLFSTASLFAQNSIPGYYITLENDTVAAQLKFKKGAFSSDDISDKIDFVTEDEGSRQFTPKEIKGFGFTDNDRDFFFISKPTKDGVNKFLTPIYIGPNASLYKYTTFSPGGGYALPNQNLYLTFEKPNENYLFAIGRTTKPFREKLKEFFAENPEVLKLLDERLQYWTQMEQDLLEIMQMANR
jgi:hypothetical protein